MLDIVGWLFDDSFFNFINADYLFVFGSAIGGCLLVGLVSDRVLLSGHSRPNLWE